MPLTTTGRNDLLTNGLTNFTHASAMTDLGTTEASGVTRQAITWAAAASGQRANSAQLTIPIGTGVTVQVGSIHSALTAGNIEAWFQIGSTLRGVGSVDATATDLIQSDGHGLTTDDRVFFTTVAGESLPTGVSATVLYFVLASGLTADAFKVATTSGGTALDITALGEVAWFKTVPQPFPSGGNLVIATSALTLDATFA
jgi:hypothetical protein